MRSKRTVACMEENGGKCVHTSTFEKSPKTMTDIFKVGQFPIQADGFEDKISFDLPSMALFPEVTLFKNVTQKIQKLYQSCLFFSETPGQYGTLLT